LKRGFATEAAHTKQLPFAINPLTNLLHTQAELLALQT
jgi:hypothetical protein